MHRDLRMIRTPLVQACTLLLALCLLLICGGPGHAQTPTTRTRPRAKRPVTARANPKATPTATPSPSPTTTPAATPSVAVSPTASPTAPAASVAQVNTNSSPSGTAAPNQSANSKFGYGDAVVEGPWWLVLVIALALLAVPVVMFWLKSRSKGETKKVNFVMWGVAIVFFVLALFLIIDLLTRGRAPETALVGNPLPVSAPALTPTPLPSTEPAKPTSAPTPPQSQEQAKSIPTPTATPSPTPTPTPIPTPFPLSVSGVKISDPNETVAGLGDTIVITVNNLKDELDREQKLAPDAERIDPRKYVLFLDDMEIKKLYPVSFDPEKSALHFKLSRPAESKDAWGNLLAGQKNSTRLAKASVGPEGKTQLRNGQTFSLRIYNPTLLKIGIVLFLAAIVGFLALAKTTPILRDSEPPQPPGGVLSRPYSLALAQVAWWSFIILGSFLFIAFVTWDFDTISSSALVLLGIGTGTALGSRMVDKSKRDATNAELRTLNSQRVNLTATIEELQSKIQGVVEARLKPKAAKKEVPSPTPDELNSLPAWRTEFATKSAALEAVKKQLADAQSSAEKPVSDGFVSDVLGDVNGVTFHRLQIVVWTIVLGMIFIWSVWQKLSMPEFSETLLALMGISAGTYIGFKIPERQTAPEEHQPPTPSQPPTTKPSQPPAQPPPTDAAAPNA